MNESQRPYPRTAAEWLREWDEGQFVWSVDMGGIGPGYEQCIQITAAEALRHMLAANYDASRWGDEVVIKTLNSELDAALFENPIIKSLGLSGAQVGAAKNLASVFYRRGPLDALSDPAVKDRKILISKNWQTERSAMPPGN